MRSKSPARMDGISAFVDRFYRDNRRSPSLSEIAKAVGISRATAYRYLVAMNESGMLFYDGKTILTKQAGKCSTGYCSAPVVGSILSGHNLMTYVALLAVLVVWFLLYKTPLGLRIRSVGENPDAASSVGMWRRAQTLKSLRVWGSTPLAPSMTMTALSAAMRVR